MSRSPSTDNRCKRALTSLSGLGQRIPIESPGFRLKLLPSPKDNST
jgi:hypothetical protein